MPFGTASGVDARNPVLDGCAYWRHLVNIMLRRVYDTNLKLPHLTLSFVSADLIFILTDAVQRD